MQTITCPCGKETPTFESRLKRKKFCSKKCFYKYRSPRPVGLVYVLHKKNPTSFRRGFTPWNKGIKTGIIPANFKGDLVGYDALHDWVNRHRGKAKTCEFCGKDSGRIEWANKSHKYKRDLKDWISLCKKCHYEYDH